MKRSPASYAEPDPFANFPFPVDVGATYTIAAVTDLPARLYGGNAQTVEVSGLDYTLHLDFSKLPISALPPPNSQKWAAVWDEAANLYKRVEFSDLLATVTGYTKAEADAAFVNVVGDTMTGNLSVPGVRLDKAAVSGFNYLAGAFAGVNRWTISLGDGTPETGANAGSNFSIGRYADNGAFIGNVLGISRATGEVNFISSITAATAPPGTNTAQVATTAFVTNGLAGKLDLTGGTLSGSLILPGTGGNGLYLYYSSATSYATIAADLTGHINISNGTATPTLRAQIRGTDGALIYTNDLVYRPAGGPWIATSDARVKTVHGDYESGLDAILALTPVRYSYNGNDSFDAPSDEAGKAGTPSPDSMHYSVAKQAKEFVGLVAQDVEGVMPEMVQQMEGYIDGEPVTDLRSLDSGPLTFALVNAVKELTARIDQLSERIEALEAPLEDVSHA